MRFSKSRFRTRPAGRGRCKSGSSAPAGCWVNRSSDIQAECLRESTGRCSDKEGITPTIALPPALLQAERPRSPRAHGGGGLGYRCGWLAAERPRDGSKVVGVRFRSLLSSPLHCNLWNPARLKTTYWATVPRHFPRAISP